ncbi:hypothetical protein DFH06DRAFT_562906 [Mycena polygramma]|nr:hypothetical protein DFH06DRAFT_562906 [Mycena polygramma]
MPLVEVSVLVKYEPTTLAGYVALDSPEDTFERLRKQLSSFGMVHPKASNVSLLPGKGVSFFWITEKNSVLQTQLQGPWKTKKKLMKRYHIERVEVKVKPFIMGQRPIVGTPLLLPPADTESGNSDFSSNSYFGPPTVNEAIMQTQVQEFLDGLQLCPSNSSEGEHSSVPVCETAKSRRGTSFGSSTRSSRNQSPEAPAVEDSQVTEETNVAHSTADIAINDSRASTSENEDMAVSPIQSPIPGLATLPARDAMVKLEERIIAENLSMPLDVQAFNEPIASQLSLELLQIRKEVASNLIKGDAILQALKNLDAEISEPPVSDNDFITKVRMEILTSELENTMVRRRAAEEAVKEIARERRPPFVCPSLMDAFVGISRLSTHALEP